MPCNTLIQPACHAAGAIIRSVVGSASNDVLTAIAQAITAGVRWVVVNTATWWLQIPSPNLAAEPAVARMQQWLLPITAAIAVGGVIAAGARMALTRRANPLIDVTGGLITVAAASTIGVAVTTLLLKAGDAWSAWILQQATGGHFTQRLVLALDLGGKAASAAVLVFGILAIVLSLVQAVLMLFRQAALIILAGVLPLAAAGSISRMTRAWVRKVTAWMLALICYKPAAAAVYAAALTMIGSGGPRTAVMGFVMLLLSVLTLPALMRFFTWTTGTIASSSGGGQLLGAATMGAIAVGAMRAAPSTTAAQDQASFLSSRLGPPPGGGPGPSGGPPTGPGGSGGPGPSGGPSGPPPSSWPAGSGRPSPGSGVTPPGAATAPGTGPGSAAPPGGAAGSTAAGAAAAAGPIVAAATGATRAAADTTRLATGAMQPGDER